MARTPSTLLLPLGAPAPTFSLADPSGRTFALGDFAKSPALVVAFVCNHCPFVKHIRAGLAAFGRDMRGLGVAVVAINSNDAERYPDDAPAKMASEARAAGWTFPYLYDETQAVAAAYKAACTPDLFLFDGARRLAYRGQFDGSRPENGVAVSGQDLRAAVLAVLAGKPVATRQLPSLGCNIKWKPGAEPAYVTAPPAAG